MKVSVFGLGYVGVTTGACLANKGHEVTGIDIKSWKVKEVREGHSPVIEKGLEEEVRQAVQKGLLHATTEARVGVLNSDVSLICVGTPSAKNGDVDLTMVTRVVEDIGVALRDTAGYHLVVIRSTVPPKTTEDLIIPLLKELSGKKLGADFGVCVNPEFLAEGSMIEDFLNPEWIVIGEANNKSGDILEDIYKDFGARIIRTNVNTAEVAKYVSNVFLALKTSFANEIGNICALYGIDANEVSEILCADYKFALSPRYLKPGFAFGGSCLPKDIRALIYQARAKGYEPRLLTSILEVNEFQKQKALLLIKQRFDGFLKNKKIAIIGVAFKQGTDDVRESPALYLIQKLLEAEAELTIYDPLALQNLEEYFQDKVRYCPNLDDALRNVQLAVITIKCADLSALSKSLNLANRKTILDLSLSGYKELNDADDVEYISLHK